MPDFDLLCIPLVEVDIVLLVIALFITLFIFGVVVSRVATLLVTCALKFLIRIYF